MPIHFDASFRPNGWMNKPWAPLLLPLTPVLMIIIASLFFRFDPKMAKTDPDTREHVKRVLHQVMLAGALFIGACSITVIWAAWGQLSPLIYTMHYGLPLMLLVVGNSLGKLRPNYTIGIRLPWTLESPVVWTRTHRFAGRLLVALCLALLLLAVTGWFKAQYFFIFLAMVLGWALVITIYAFVISRQEHGSAPTGMAGRA